MKYLLSILFSFLVFFTFGQKTLIHAGKVLDGIKEKPSSEQTLIVEEGKIVGVVSGYQSPEGDDIVIDLKEMTVLPGLIDMHVHVEGETSPDRYLKMLLKTPPMLPMTRPFT